MKASLVHDFSMLVQRTLRVLYLAVSLDEKEEGCCGQDVVRCSKRGAWALGEGVVCRESENEEEDVLGYSNEEEVEEFEEHARNGLAQGNPAVVFILADACVSKVEAGKNLVALYIVM